MIHAYVLNDFRNDPVFKKGELSPKILASNPVQQIEGLTGTAFSFLGGLSKPR